MKQLIIVICCVVLGACAGGNSTNEKTSLTPAEFDEQSKTTAEAILIDVRTAEEVQSGYIKGAINMDYKRPEFKLLIAGMDKTKPYFVYCLSGMRSGKAADFMREQGFEHVMTLDGGIKAWTAAGLPVVTPAPAP
ncbi:MAG TPA: rhodanese-like domain-containing protein [Cyclobacteriaceae bacterium]|nr:rhodanese-like domain-containing protein [Cyclobacteriaceae bacterium]